MANLINIRFTDNSSIDAPLESAGMYAKRHGIPVEKMTYQHGEHTIEVKPYLVSKPDPTFVITWNAVVWYDGELRIHSASGDTVAEAVNKCIYRSNERR